MSSTSRWGNSRGLASTLLSLVRSQSSPPKDDSLATSSKKSKHRKQRDGEQQQLHDHNDDDDDAMTTTSQELPPLRNDQEASEGEADFGALEVFDSNAAISSQAVESASTRKSKRDKKKEKREHSSASKSQRRASRNSSSANGHDEADEVAGPASPSRKKRKNSDASDGKDRKKRKSHGDSAVEPIPLRRRNDEVPAIDSIPEEQVEPELQNSPSAARSHRRGQSGDGADMNGDDAEQIERDVEAVAREAWQEHINKQAAAAQQDTEMAEAPAVVAEAPAEDASGTPRRARSTRKKSKPTYFDQPVTEATLDAYGNLPSPSAMTPKPRRAKKAASKKGPRRQRKADRERDLYGEDVPRAVYTQGKFSDDELSRIAHALESFRAEYGMEQRDVNEMIQAPGGTSAGEAHAQLWVRIFAECPDRHRQKVINVARKKFHNFVARGTWTIEQDNELAGLINTHGPKWSYIAGIVNRHPEDIRDRYRNYLVCGGAQKKEAWDNDEEARLTQYVQDAMRAIDEMRIEDPSKELLRKPYEELIDWQNISERMERTRSRLQCITKWKAMNLRLQGKDKLASADPNSNISFRLERARRQLEDMPDTEKYRLVLAINSVSASTVAKIPWQRLCDKQFRSEWHHSTQELVWNRLTKSVPGAELRTVRDCAQYLVDKYNQDNELPNIGGEGWDDDEEMTLISQVPFGNKERQGISSQKLTAGDMEGDNAEPEPETQEMQIDPALDALTEVPQSAQKATPAKRTQNGKRPSGRKPKRPVEPIEESADVPVDAEAANGDELDESSHRKRKTPSKFRKTKASTALAQPSSDMEDMEDLPSRVEEA